jgi:rare lipoprotein A
MRKPLVAGWLAVAVLAATLWGQWWLILQLLVPAPTAAESKVNRRVNRVEGLPTLNASEVIEGEASWYGPGFHGRLTASGTLYNRYALTAAHRKLRPGTVVRVTNLRNRRSAVLVINDWGPVPKDRVIDVSEAAADVLGFREQGLAPVRIEVYRAANAPL